jgi:hypothetical protein
MGSFRYLEQDRIMKAVETWGYLGFNRRLHAYEVLLGDASQATGHCVSPELLDQSLTPISNVMQDDFWCLWPMVGAAIPS